MAVSEQKLSDVLSDFAETMVTDFAIQAILDRLVLRIVDMMPISSAGVTLISPHANPRYVAASDSAALRFEKLQTELGEGPCVEAYTSGQSVSVPDLHAATDFPLFAKRAVAEGLLAVFTFPLRAGERRLGALDLYRDTPGSLDADTLTAAQTLADVASAYLLNAQARDDLRDSYDRVHETSLHDPLTGLPNRVLFGQRLEHAVQRSRRSEKMAAILFVDLDRFKAVNDTHGHIVGDELLVAVADRLATLLRPGDSLARMSGDEFVILCEDLDEAGPAEALAERIGAGFAEPFELSGVTVEISASVGIAFAGRGDTIPERLLEDADAAMYQAKRLGGARHQVLDIREQSLTEHHASLSSDLREALDRGELATHYQPIVRTNSGRVVGLEAFLRWFHPEFGSVLPITAVGIAEQMNLINDIGKWVLEKACRDRRHLADVASNPNLGMAVNISPQQIMSSDFVADVAAILFRTDTEPKLITLEVTEAMFLEDPERALVVLDQLKHLGVMLALDDFGTGYSSLNYLKMFPLDYVKVDQGYVAELPQDNASRAIVSAVVGLAHALGIEVVAEGVETSVQRSEIASLECNYSQGYFFARPMSAHDVGAFLIANEGNRSRAS